MSTHTYDRKSYYGGYADANQGDPSLMVSIETAFPGYKFVVRSRAGTTDIVFEADLNAGQVVTLDGVYAAWDPETTPPSVTLPHTLSLTQDVSTTSQTFIDLLSGTVSLPSDARRIYAEVSGECTVKTANLEFQMLIDGVVVKGFYVYARGVGSASEDVALAVGDHEFKLQWRVTAGNGKIRAASNDLEHALIRIS